MNDEEWFETPMALLLGRAMGNHWKAPHGCVYIGSLAGSRRRDLVTMTNTNEERLKEIENTLNVRILLNDRDMDSATYQALFELLKELNS